MSKKNKSIKTKVCHEIIDQDHDGQRLDNFLITQYKNVPKARLYRALRKGEVRVNSARCKPFDRITQGDTIRLPPLLVQDRQQPLPLHISDNLSWLSERIIFEDDGLMVINKPADLAVHGGQSVHVSLLRLISILRPEQKYIRLVHRIDKATSGCLLIAKSRAVLLQLQLQFKQHTPDKRYLAICVGKINKDKLDLKNKLRKDRQASAGAKVVIDNLGKLAVSKLRALTVGKALTLVEVEIITGRTHQIRVQCAHVHLPILGDDKYGNFNLNQHIEQHAALGLMLHCQSIGVYYNNKKYVFTAPAPDWKDEFLDYDQLVVLFNTALNAL